jgi:hypothetical protein
MTTGRDGRPPAGGKPQQPAELFYFPWLSPPGQVFHNPRASSPRLAHVATIAVNSCLAGIFADDRSPTSRARLPLHRFVQVPVGLQPHPELWRRFQQSRESQRRIRRDAPLPEDNLVQPVERDAEPLRRFKLPEAERLQVLF